MIDWVSRITREESILDVFYQGYPKEKFEDFHKKIKGNTYLHIPTKKLVRIAGIEEKTNVTDPHPDRNYTDWVDYYYKSFGLEVTDEH